MATCSAHLLLLRLSFLLLLLPTTPQQPPLPPLSRMFQTIPLRNSIASRLVEQQFPTRATGEAAEVRTPVDVIFVEGSHALFVSSFMDDQVLRVDTRDPALTPRVFASGIFCSDKAKPCAIMDGPWGLAHREVRNGGLLFVSSFGSDQILLFDSSSGDYIGAFGNEEQLNCPEGLAFSADGDQLYVVSFLDNRVVAYDVSELIAHGVPCREAKTTKKKKKKKKQRKKKGKRRRKGRRRASTAESKEEEEEEEVESKDGGDGALPTNSEACSAADNRFPEPRFLGPVIPHNAGLLSPEDILVLPGSGDLLVSSYGTNNVVRFLSNGTMVEVFAGNASLPWIRAVDKDDDKEKPAGVEEVEVDAAAVATPAEKPAIKKERKKRENTLNRMTLDAVPRGKRSYRGGRGEDDTAATEEETMMLLPGHAKEDDAEVATGLARYEGAEDDGNHGGVLSGPVGITLGARGSTLLVASYKNHQVVEYDLETGEYLGTFASGAGLRAPSGMCFIDSSSGSGGVSGVSDSRSNREEHGTSRDGDRLLIASYNSNKIVVFQAAQQGGSHFSHVI